VVFKGPPYAVPGQGVECIGDVQRHSNNYPALPHGLLRQAPDAEYGVNGTPGPAEAELLTVQVGSHLF